MPATKTYYITVKTHQINKATYSVTAQSEDEARDRWADGFATLLETTPHEMIAETIESVDEE